MDNASVGISWSQIPDGIEWMLTRKDEDGLTSALRREVNGRTYTINGLDERAWTAWPNYMLLINSGDVIAREWR